MFSVVTNFFWCIIGFLQTYNGAVTAIATVAIGIFTFFLVCVSNRQARLTRRSVEISEAALIGLERPRLIISDVNFGIINDKRRAQIGLINFGRDPAHVTQIVAKFFAENLPVIPDFTAAEIRNLDTWILPATVEQPRQGRVGYVFEGVRETHFFAIKILYEWDFGKYERALACTTGVAPGVVPENAGEAAYNYERKRT